jgi:hypothetical protein
MSFVFSWFVFIGIHCGRIGYRKGREGARRKGGRKVKGERTGLRSGHSSGGRQRGAPYQ